jgi:BirA family biotin operon repressor/biotin-[acetyl-CoA-carboxylase] ligase
MSQPNLQLQRQLLALLADGKFHSGQRLAEQFGLSRTAIANNLQQLTRLGLDIYKLKGKGYALAMPLQLLDAAVIRSMQTVASPEIRVQHITDSTNAQLLNLVQAGKSLQPGQVIVAEAQTAGRGRRGRSWFSPFGSSLYFSCYWRLEQGIQAAMGLSLVVACVLAELIAEDYQVKAQLKWPNDLYLNGKKAAGILVELAGQADGICDVVIGIGVNIYLPGLASQAIDQPYIDLQSVTAKTVDRNILVARLQQALLAALADFNRCGFLPFQQRFNQLDLFAGKPVQLSGSTSIQGICRGVDQQGALLIETATGVQAFYGGELSLRGAA